MNFSHVKYLIFVIVISILYSCNGDNEHSDIAFVKFFGDGTNDYGIDVCEQNNTIYVLSNAKDKETGKEHPYLYFLNSNGEYVDIPLSLDELRDSSYNEYSQKLLCDDENNLFVISNVSDDVYTEKIYVRKIKNRAVVWSKYFGQNFYSASSTDAILSGNSIIIIGNVITSSSNINLDAYVLEVDKEEGEYIKDKKILGIEGDEEVSNVIKVDDVFYIVGYSESNKVPGVTQESATWLVEINKNYETENSYGSERINEGICLEKIGSTIAVASSERRTVDDERKLKVYGININNITNVIWETSFEETKNLVPADIIPTNNGFIVVANKYSNQRIYGNICVLYYDNEGSLISKKDLGASSNATFLQAEKSILFGDELLIVGYNETNDENSDVALIKLNSSDVIYE